MPDANRPRPPLLFLSHAGIDTEAARALKRRIEAAPEAREHGLRVWFDKDDLRAGEPWQAQLEEAIRHRSAAFAVYVGSRGVVNWVDAEVQLALGRAVTDPAYRFIPILAPQAPGPEALPGFVALYQGVADVEGRPDQFAKLVAAVLGQDTGGTAKLEAEPFFGLKAVDEDRAHLFFGREQETEALLQLLRREPLVMVTGDSGSGKSSLARAGLVPRWHGGALAEAIGERPAETIWHVVQTQPRTRPFQALAEAVSEAARRLGLSLADRGTLESWVRSGDPDQVRRALWCDLPPDRTRVLLLVDQFEELVTIAEPAEREPFVRLLLALADPNDPRARVVLTMRRDYYNLVSTFPELYDRLEADGHRARQILGRISPDGLRRIVTEPLRLAGVPEGDRTALADQVAAEMGDRPGDLALVQMALTETWNRRQGFGDDLLRAYAGIGRIEGAIARAAEDVYAAVLDDAERALAEPVFIRLIRLGDTGGATRRLATRGEFDDAKWRLVQKLASKEAKRLVLTGGGEAGETAEIAHEALVTQWPRYQTWLSGRDPDGADRAADKRALDALTQRVTGWATAPDAHAKGKRLATGADLDAFVGLVGRRPAWLSAEEHKLVSDSREAAIHQQRRERWLFRGVVAAAVVALVAAGSAWQQRNHAIAQAKHTQTAIGRLLGTEAQRLLAEPITQETSPLIAALAATSWRLGRTSDAWNAMQRVPLITTLARISHNNAVGAVAFSPDGKSLATASGVSHRSKGEARIVAVADGRELARITHDNAVEAVAFSPDGTLLATASGGFLRAGEARIVAVADGRELVRISHNNAVGAVAFSPDGKSLATASEDKTARIVAVADGRELVRITHDDTVTAVAFSPDGKSLATASASADISGTKGEARIVAVADGRELVRITHDDTVTAVAFSPDGKSLATASASADISGTKGEARIVAVADGRELARIAHDGMVTAVAFSPDGKSLATASLDKTARIVAVADGRELARITHDDMVRTVAFSPDGQLLATASDDGTARIVAVADSRELARITHDHQVGAVAFSPDGKSLATASGNFFVGEVEGEARIVAVADGRELARISHDGMVWAVAFSPDGQLLATASDDKTARIVAVADGHELVRIAHDGMVWAVAFSPDGQLLATASDDKTARIVAVADGRELARITHDDVVKEVAFSPDGRLLATASDDGTARIVAVADSRERARITHDNAVWAVWAVAFSPDGQLLATAIGNILTSKGEARIIAVADGRELVRITHDDAVTAVAFSPDGKSLATASAAISGTKGEARIVAVADGHELARIAHDGMVWAVAFSPDGKVMATASGNFFFKKVKGEARIVAVADGRERARITHDDAVTAVAFSPDGKIMATASWDNTVRLWSTALDDMLHQLCTGHGRNLSPGEWRRYLGDLPWQPTCENWPTPED